MGKISTFLATSILATTLASTAFAATPDVYVVNFTNNKDANSQTLDQKLYPALDQVRGNIEHVIIDTSTAARWEKGAHEAFDREIVPVFNKWVGLPGFAAVVNAKTKQVIGCVNPNFSTEEMAQHIKQMTSQVSGEAYVSRTAFSGDATDCPPAYNTPPK